MNPVLKDMAPALSRRGCLVGTAAAAVAASDARDGVAMPSVQSFPYPLIADDESLERALPVLSNWGVWGPDDQLGTLNFITAKMRVAAAGLIRSGRVLALGREISTATPELRNFSYKMDRYLDPLPEEAGCLDTIGMTCHGFGVTHVDALCHIFTPEGRQGMYNGYPVEAVTPDGAARLGIEHVGTIGISGRGVLLDMAGANGGPLPLGSAITPEELEAAERLQGIRIGEGDILFVRNGAGSRNTHRNGTGLHAACLPWLHNRRVAVLGNDSDGDAHPAMLGFSRWSEPMHMVAIPYMGLTLIDQVELDGLAAACREERRWVFFVSAAPWRFKGATGAVINPLAFF